jgi:mannan endo-1,4-beta-mannosidase
VSSSDFGTYEDEYSFTGEITSFTLNGEADIRLDGEPVSLSELNSTNGGSGSDPSQRAFVSTTGAEFTLDGERYPLRGANNYMMVYPWWDRSVAEEVMRKAAAMGLNTIRTWGFGEGHSQYFHPAPTEYNDAAFERLDYVIERARENDLRLIISLANNLGDFGGAPQYVEWSDTAEMVNGNPDQFYTDEQCRRWYKQYVEYVLTRENSISGIEYREDPTIMLWELSNELRHPSSPAWDASILSEWCDTMAAHVKSIDSNHLVSTGAEGLPFVEEEKYDDFGYWTKEQGTAYKRIHGSEHIDAASWHFYPDYWRIESSGARRQFLLDRSWEARERLGMPGYCGEFGAVNKKATIYSEWYGALAEQDAAGAAFWQLVDNNNRNDGDSFAVVYPDDEDVINAIETGVRKI